MPIIEWADWQAAQANINAANKAVSGMTPAEAQAALKFGQTGLQNGSNLQIVNSQNVSASAENVIQFPGSSASQATGEYIAAGGQVTASGAASTGATTSQVNNLAMTQKAGGLASVGALLSVNLPTAAAAIAPIAGVALGAGLYSLNPELWTKISEALLPFCYKDTELLPVVADEAGNTYFPKEAIDAVKNAISANVADSASAPGLGLESRISPYPFSYAINSEAVVYSGVDYRFNYFKVATSTPTHMCIAINSEIYTHPSGAYTSQSFFLTYASKEPFKYGSSDFINVEPVLNNDATEVTMYGQTFYYGGVLTSVRPSIQTFSLPKNVNIGLDTGYQKNLAYAMLFGDISIAEQPGVTKWTGTQYPLNPEGIGVVTRISPDGQLVTTAPYYPVTMPVGDPGVSPNPNEVPVPGTNPEVAPAVNPWLTPGPNPNTYPDGQPKSDPAKVPDPVPDTDPNLDPNANPSQQPEAQPQPDPDPVQSTKPIDGGVSPLPVIPIVPVLPSASAGLLHVYNPTQSQIDAFGSWLWTTFSGDLIDTISKLFNDPMDAVIGLHELYATPSISGSSTIRAGFLDSGVSSSIVGDRYTTINCGSIVVQEYYQNYLDYSPYTKCYIYLPFVGIVPVLADDIVGNAVNITYHVDSYTGCCIAVVTVAREGYSSTVYQFEGNCAVEIPITSGYQSTLMGALIGAGATALTGNPHAGIAAANMGRASLGKNDVSHSGSFGSSYGAMGAKIPYIIVKRPTQKSVVNYNQDYGFPAHKRVTIGACSGYLRAREVHVISPTATDDEKARIEEMLKQGVFVK